MRSGAFLGVVLGDGIQVQLGKIRATAAAIGILHKGIHLHVGAAHAFAYRRRSHGFHQA